MHSVHQNNFYYGLTYSMIHVIVLLLPSHFLSYTLYLYNSLTDKCIRTPHLCLCVDYNILWFQCFSSRLQRIYEHTWGMCMAQSGRAIHWDTATLFLSTGCESNDVVDCLISECIWQYWNMLRSLTPLHAWSTDAQETLCLYSSIVL